MKEKPKRPNIESFLLSSAMPPPDELHRFAFDLCLWALEVESRAEKAEQRVRTLRNALLEWIEVHGDADGLLALQHLTTLLEHKLLDASSSESPKCACGNTPTCFGSYDGEALGYGCDTCCGHGNEVARLKRERDELERIVEAQNATIAALREGVRPPTFCAWCLTNVPLGEMPDHILACDRHPVREYEARCEALETALRAIVAISEDREAFVRDGPRGWMRAERIAKAALLTPTGDTDDE